MKFYYLLFTGIYLTSGIYSFNVSDQDLFNEIILQRVKRSSAPNNTVNNYTTTTTPIPPPPPPTMNRTASYIITSFNSSATTTTATRTTTTTTVQTTVSLNLTSSTVSMTTRSPNNTSLYNPDTCTTPGYIKLMNDTCVTKAEAQIIAAGILRNGLKNDTYTVNALALYISSITNSTTLSNKTNTFSYEELDELVDELCNLNATVNSNTSFVMIQQPVQDGNRIVLGASYKRGVGGEIVDTTNQENITKSFLSAAAIVSKESLSGVVSLNLLIIDQPTIYENADIRTRKSLASSVIIANLRRNSSTYNSVLVSLYYNPLVEYKRRGPGKYICSYYDTTNSQWDESGCTNVQFNKQYSRYECNCTHLTSFALVWLPENLSYNGTKYLDPQDIASLVFQSISIICFIGILIHATIVRYSNPLMRIQTLKLLPLVSTAGTTILFIFFIALGMTVYTQTSSSNQNECFLTSKILMFITYYLLIYMFCIKTSAGYFYYLRFVRLFPQPSHRQLVLMILISFIISTICAAIAIGLNTNSSFNIIQLYPYKLCWFTRDVIYYFLTIPIGIFLFINIITVTLVARSIITHALHGATRQRKNERMKRCAIILLSSCVTQGIGWLFGPFISFVNPLAGNILGWFFIILNGLEGFWTIVLYLLIRSQRIDEQKHVEAAMKIAKSGELSSNKDKKIHSKNENERYGDQTIDRNGRKDRLYSFNDLRKRDTDAENEYYEGDFK